MNNPDPLKQLLEQLWKRPALSEIPEDLIAAIASDKEALAQLETLRSILAEQALALTCEQCQDKLGAYVETQLAGEDTATRYADVKRHLRTCSDCRTHYQLLRELQQDDTAAAPGRSPAAPTFDFDEWYRQQVAASPWRQLSQGVRQLATEIVVLVEKATVSFGSLVPPLLSVQLVPVSVARGGISAGEQAPTEETEEVLELPDAEANSVISVRMGPVSNMKSTLIVEVSAITPPRPIAQARVTLRDAAGEMLEVTATDENGRGIFRSLEVDKYEVHVEHDGHDWSFRVTIVGLLSSPR
jgi:hypothetical protein